MTKLLVTTVYCFSIFQGEPGPVGYTGPQVQYCIFGHNMQSHIILRKVILHDCVYESSSCTA